MPHDETTSYRSNAPAGVDAAPADAVHEPVDPRAPRRDERAAADAERLAVLPDPGAVLFDLDGTLVDTVGTRVRGWVAALAEYGLVAPDRAVGPLIGSDGRFLVRQVASQIGRELQPGEDAEIDRRAGELYDLLNTAPAPLPGARSVLEALARSSLPYSIATSSLPGQVLASVASLGLTVAPRIVDGSHVRHAKPAPDLLLLGAERLAVAPESCWYVGDSVWDVQAGRAAAMTTVAVATGFSSREELEAEGASAAIASLDAVVSDLARRGLVPEHEGS